MKDSEEIKKLKLEIKSWRSVEVRDRFNSVNSELPSVVIAEIGDKIKRLKRGEDI